ncbi:chemotaxis protein CheB [Novosphingobium sp. MMS21-SN21R]|uniref:chemotaxis protein CheB n=1 Tax=Novosphingobium sp. MMS21-SN21R TaxID=2969298 RepID=UPI0028846117|nr:chemotaxis protein CheB [Novosphingobium sp. MMS21-SN21R]MDT0506831.1 chemotaxis protein CheB [Novosphingobium sp. MMS21-SN21R]
MHEARVLVVDDSAAMRALFSDILDQAKNVTVIGAAANAAEARDQIRDLKPNVVTLDVEMPGMSGIEFLAEIMGSAPLPVVMLSSLTQAGTETSLKAYELGAVECFPKPLKATPEQFSKTVGKLGKIVLAAANSNVKDRRAPREHKQADTHFEWNGHIVALSASMGGIDALTQMLTYFPEKCPPTVIALNAEPAVVETFIKRMDGELKCAVKAAKDGTPLTPGTIHIAFDPDRHAVIEPGSPPKLRLIDRDPVEGMRPSANLLFGSIARGSVPAAAAVLTGMGSDGAKGLRIMRDSGCKTFAQDRSTALVAEAPSAAIDAGAADSELALDDLGTALIACCSMS